MANLNWAFNPYALKPWFTRRLSLFIYWAESRSISPDVFTLVGILGALIGAVVLALPGFSILLPWWLSVILVFLFGFVLRLAGANLDGAVARARGVSRPQGFILNEIGDRGSDFLLFFGLYLGTPEPWRPYVVLVAMLASFPTLISISGAAVGATRINGGPFGKTERTFAFVIAGGLILRGLEGGNSFIFGALLALVAFGSIHTAWRRYRLIGLKVSEEGTDWVDDQPTVIKGSLSK